MAVQDVGGFGFKFTIVPGVLPQADSIIVMNNTNTIRMPELEIEVRNILLNHNAFYFIKGFKNIANGYTDEKNSHANLAGSILNFLPQPGGGANNQQLSYKKFIKSILSIDIFTNTHVMIRIDALIPPPSIQPANIFVTGHANNYCPVIITRSLGTRSLMNNYINGQDPLTHANGARGQPITNADLYRELSTSGFLSCRVFLNFFSKLNFLGIFCLTNDLHFGNTMFDTRCGFKELNIIDFGLAKDIWYNPIADPTLTRPAIGTALALNAHDYFSIEKYIYLLYNGVNGQPHTNPELNLRNNEILNILRTNYFLYEQTCLTKGLFPVYFTRAQINAPHDLNSVMSNVFQVILIEYMNPMLLPGVDIVQKLEIRSYISNRTTDMYIFSMYMNYQSTTHSLWGNSPIMNFIAIACMHPHPFLRPTLTTLIEFLKKVIKTPTNIVNITLSDENDEIITDIDIESKIDSSKNIILEQIIQRPRRLNPLGDFYDIHERMSYTFFIMMFFNYATVFNANNNHHRGYVDGIFSPNNILPLDVATLGNFTIQGALNRMLALGVDDAARAQELNRQEFNLVRWARTTILQSQQPWVSLAVEDPIEPHYRIINPDAVPPDVQRYNLWRRFRDDVDTAFF